MPLAFATSAGRKKAVLEEEEQERTPNHQGKYGRHGALCLFLRGFQMFNFPFHLLLQGVFTESEVSKFYGEFEEEISYTAITIIRVWLAVWVFTVGYQTPSFVTGKWVD
ncbi:hypothetical protein SAY86_014420 [Trapa natans]|uniref:Uncharacterized protein n=1 Tax=Trapa natans TaxID=22666 RepID=A0AAN7KZ52_TRANT|nr:hypothetical protein SAY86_014420 [Trapa natans]